MGTTDNGNGDNGIMMILYFFIGAVCVILVLAPNALQGCTMIIAVLIGIVLWSYLQQRFFNNGKGKK
jgi:hypothetical protein